MVNSIISWNGRIYIFLYLGSQYYRLTINTNGGALLSADSGYPLPLSHWRLGIEKVDAAVKTTGGNNYFFHDGLFYLFDNSNVQVSLFFLPSSLACSNLYFLHSLYLFVGMVVSQSFYRSLSVKNENKKLAVLIQYNKHEHEIIK